MKSFTEIAAAIRQIHNKIKTLNLQYDALSHCWTEETRRKSKAEIEKEIYILGTLCWIIGLDTSAVAPLDSVSEFLTKPWLTR